MSSWTEDSLAQRLQWHTIAVIFLSRLLFVVRHMYSSVILVHLVIPACLVTIVLSSRAVNLCPR